ncbi:MAG: hypothetical protein ALECFALPRED_008318 [Alectoria fallacina]|uniref:Uncharacterized protein n=1 Tax=Alectoria fallacina TaxID=1903189 RepID=A0A8H3I2R9_9LECA|nr:MAG: hypothetical protein ALECFALPRED_008318 [Alectoria fallacina]
MTKYVNPYGLSAKIDNLIAARSLPMQALTKLMGHGKRLIEYLKQPHVQKLMLKLAISYFASFAIVFAFLAGIGFGPLGVGAGSLAAAFQSAVYGGFVPAGGLFATLTSMGMLGTLTPLFLGLAALIATAATTMLWRFCFFRR